MVKVAVLNNGYEDQSEYFISSSEAIYFFIDIGNDFSLELNSYSCLIIPFGSDNVALYRCRSSIQNFLNQGNTVLSFDGCYTNWLPGIQWFMDNSYPTKKMRYKLYEDTYGLFKEVDLKGLIYSSKKSGWWTNGFLHPQPTSHTIMCDNYNRPIMVLDEEKTNGLIIAISAAPLSSEVSHITNDTRSQQSLKALYNNIMDFIVKRYS